ncbi:MAG: MFS transporter, partial [Novibacillus thermophilus]
PMAQEITGMSAITAASVVGLLGLFNGLGRIGWASLSDYIGRPNVYIAFFVIQVTAFFLLPNITSQVVFPILLYIIITCYGGGFASLPAFIGDLFGTKQLGAIHGYLLTSWSMAGVVGPMVVSYIYDTTQSYTTTFTIFNVLLVIALVTSLAMRLNIKKIREKQGVSDVQKPLTT